MHTIPYEIMHKVFLGTLLFGVFSLTNAFDCYECIGQTGLNDIVDQIQPTPEQIIPQCIAGEGIPNSHVRNCDLAKDQYNVLNQILLSLKPSLASDSNFIKFFTEIQIESNVNISRQAEWVCSSGRLPVELHDQNLHGSLIARGCTLDAGQPHGCGSKTFKKYMEESLPKDQYDMLIAMLEQAGAGSLLNTSIDSCYCHEGKCNNQDHSKGLSDPPPNSGLRTTQHAALVAGIFTVFALLP